jgi:hypothetical protein
MFEVIPFSIISFFEEGKKKGRIIIYRKERKNFETKMQLKYTCKIY